jgi:stage II sporulation protein M
MNQTTKMKRIRQYTTLSALVFFLAVAVGYFSATREPIISEMLTGRFSDLVTPFADFNQWQIFLVIFFNNSIKVFMAILLGLFFAIIPFLFLAINGLVIGVVARIIQIEEGLGFFWAGVLPHGIIEIPAVLVGAGLGIALGVRVTKHIFKIKRYDIRQELRGSIKIFYKYVLPALFIAAIIEAFITPIVIAQFLS